VQGFLRKIYGNDVKIEDWEEKEALSYVDILHADEVEAKILSGEEDIKKCSKETLSIWTQGGCYYFRQKRKPNLC